MNIRRYLLIGFSLAELGITVCRGQTGCPSAPVTPYPVQKTTAYCPNQPIPAYPAKPNPVSTCPTIPTQNGCCHNQQINPCPLPITNPACSNQCPPVHSGSANPVSQCCQGCCSTTPNCGSANKCCGQQACCQTEPPNVTTPLPPFPETVKPYEPPSTISPPPEPLIKCPSGTQLIGKECHLIYCPLGSQMLNDRCVVIECPEGTVWTGHRCSVPQPIIQNLTFYNTVTTQFNQTKPDIILHTTNNIVVNASLTLYDENNNNNINECNNDYGDCKDTIPTTTTPQPKLKCCVVMTPRMCKNHNGSWRCYSRSSRRCGEFCVAPITYLRPSRVHYGRQYVVMPPTQNDCQLYGNCGPARGGHDCSGCAMNHMDRCSYYCYHYSCPSRKCDFYDQERYCALNAGSYGCQEEDGCFDSWCL